jgi:hypothetical protein
LQQQKARSRHSKEVGCLLWPMPSPCHPYPGSFHFGQHTLQLFQGDQNHSFKHFVVMSKSITISAR